MSPHTARHARLGFTLIEIVVVLVIVSVLSGIAVQNFSGVRAKTDAARIATQLHYLEDAIIEAILTGATANDFRIEPERVEGSVLGDYLTSANLTDVPEGVRFRITPATNPRGFRVLVGIVSDRSHAKIIEQLHGMFPATAGMAANGQEIWIQIDSHTLAPIDIATLSGA